MSKRKTDGQQFAYGGRGSDGQLHGLVEQANARLRECLSSTLKLVDDGLLVRDTSKDHEAGWTMKQLPIVLALQAAQQALADTDVKENT